MKIEIYDTTLRDGAQGAGISFTAEDKKKIISALDRLCVDYIEIGNFASNGIDIDLINNCDKIHVKHARLCAFGSTRRANSRIESEPEFAAVATSPIKTVAIFGKSWLYQVYNVLATDPAENLSMIYDTVKYLKDAGKEVIFDAEHFFDGYSENPEYALSVLQTAHSAGADTLVLCDTRGGMLPDIIGMTCGKIRTALPQAKLGIHCHNDIGMAVASSVSAVLEGTAQIQGTISGMGERCGNANLNTLIPLLQIKLGYKCIPEEKLSQLTKEVRYINEVCNRKFDESEPFVGGYAFTHKAGMHIDAVKKAPLAFEHTDPSIIGNSRNLLISDIAGRAAVQDKMETLLPGVSKDDPKVRAALEKIKEYESKGYTYENADASLMLLMRDAIGTRKRFFELIKYQVTVNESKYESYCTALINISVDGKQEITAAEGEGPVNAMDIALRRALGRFYPEVENARLTDYKVRVINSSDTTASKVCVFIETADDVKIWHTTGVSVDIIDASWQALADAVEYKLYETREGQTV